MKYFSVIMSELDYKLIIHVKKLREERGISQRGLSEKMKLSKSFVGKVEALGQPDKYSIRHLQLLADSLELKHVKELFNGIKVEHDLIEILYEKVSKLNKGGSESKQFEERIIEMRSIGK